MAQQLSALPAFPEDRMHTSQKPHRGHSYLYLYLVLGDLMSSSDLRRHQARVQYISIHVGNRSCTQNKN